MASSETEMGVEGGEPEGLPSMTHWNYRVVRHPAPEDSASGEYLEIVEVFYEGDAPCAYGSATVGGDDVGEMRDVMAMMLAALEKPILPVEVFGPSPSEG